MNTTQGVASSQDTLLTCKITFLKVLNVPVADLHNLSCDPYLQATLSAENNIDTDPQIITYRTHTCRQELNPEFNASWIVSGVPSSGFLLSVRLRDEDPGNYDDNLGKAVLKIPNPNEGKLGEGWKSGDREYKVRKRKGSILSQVFTFTARALTRGDIGHRVRLWVRVEVLGKAENQDDRRLYTVGPQRYVRHFSPLLGRFLGTTNSPDEGKHTGAIVKPSAFIANRVQLAGPIPSTLRHRYVGFAPFVKAMFRRRGIRGILLHHALHRQHVSIYKWDKNVAWGVIGDHDEMPQGEEKERERKPSEEPDGSGHDSDSIAMARQFLRMTSHGTNGRMFTYVIMLDGELRFTETGDQLTIEFLSKHTMHSDVTVEIAYSGEFFVRPLRRHASDEPAEDGNPRDVHFDEDDPPDNPSFYELVIDNDSGTYRPRADLLPTLHDYLASPRNFGALGKVTTMDGFDERLKKWKDARKKAKGGETAVQVGLSSSDSSSSSSVSGASSVGDSGEVRQGDMKAVLEEDAKRARENDDDDPKAVEEEDRAGNGEVSKAKS